MFMRRTVTTIAIGTAVVLAFFAQCKARAADIAGTIAQARRLIEAKDHASALVILEDLLLEAEPKDSHAIIDLLRKSYDVFGATGSGGGPRARGGPLS